MYDGPDEANNVISMFLLNPDRRADVEIQSGSFERVSKVWQCCAIDILYQNGYWSCS